MNVPFPEYPRPQLRRSSWTNLNGLWDYAITQSDTPPTQYDGSILVPYSPECKASGVERTVGELDYLWYRREVSLEPEPDKRYLLHFGAVDQRAVVYWNGHEVGRHIGGYLPFTFEVTESVTCCNELIIAVQDGTDNNELLRGKQKTKRGGIWYTPQSGIWQTVWLEEVPELYVTGLRITPKPTLKQVEITVQAEEASICYINFQGRSYGGITNKPIRISMQEFVYWTPECPQLYDFSVTLREDTVESYFAMRCLSTGINAKGQPCLLLNGKPLFQSGVLDQGYWPEGLYTPPSDEAFVKDIQNMKALGFNMLRKHIKIEPLRFYYHCDRLGMLVWQDTVNGGGNYRFTTITAPLVTGIHLKDTNYRRFAREDASCRELFRTELLEMISHLYNSPSVVLWVIFNEGWGQFDSAELTELVRKTDPTRWIDHASGWHDQGAGDIMSRHVYFVPYRFRKDRFRRPVALTEFGGYTCVVGKSSGGKLFGYTGNKSTSELNRDIKRLYSSQILPAAEKGLCACVYTQVSDVEDEQNGFYSFDRSICKVIPEDIRVLNEQLYAAFNSTEAQ